MKKVFLKRLYGLNRRNLKDSPKVWSRNKFGNFKKQTELWMDDVTFNRRVGGE